ncbi:uncharacterized protein [Dermacentor albipictus]|uniref:uncharacterized protein isoform X2 n=1 Tax=Dermacentor albipictus TaxID=60249 RepID=UPI0038FC1BE8
MPFTAPTSSGQHCVVVGCGNNQRKRKNIANSLCEKHAVKKEQCGCDMFLLHRFPANVDLGRQWTSLINRKDFVPNRNSRVCSAHFVDGKRTEQNPLPMLNLGYQRKVIFGRRRLNRDENTPAPTKRKRKTSRDTRDEESRQVPSQSVTYDAQASTFTSLLDSLEYVGDSAKTILDSTCACQETEETSHSEPAVFTDAFESEPAAAVHMETTSFNNVLGNEDAQCNEDTFPSSGTVCEPDVSLHIGNSLVRCTLDKAPDALTYGVATPDSSVAENEVCGSLISDHEVDIHVSKTEHIMTRKNTKVMKDSSTQWELPPADHSYTSTRLSMTMRTISYRTLTSDDILFYTGISVTAFDKLVSALKTQDKTIRKLLTIEDQLLLTLMRLRLGLLCGDLARRFEVSVAYVSRTFSRVLDDLVNIMQEVVVWLPRSRLRASMPESFRNSEYSHTTCIFDCTEALMQRPRKLMARSQSYSQYKGANTMKFLTVIAPNGFIMFVSDVYGGRASDKYIVKTCGVEEYLLPGDEIMADRGFKLDPYLEAQGIKMNRPAFTKGKDQLPESEVTETRRIASLRIHVERAINRIKTYRIFKQVLPIKSRKYASKIVLVCAGLCNLKRPLINEQTKA